MYRWYFHDARSRTASGPASSAGSGSFTSPSVRWSAIVVATSRTTSARVAWSSHIVSGSGMEPSG